MIGRVVLGMVGVGTYTVRLCSAGAVVLCSCLGWAGVARPSVSLSPLPPEPVDTVHAVGGAVERVPAWLYARALFHGKAPREVYATALRSVATADLLRQFGRLPSPACDAFASAVAEELYARPDVGPAVVAGLDEDTRLRLADALQRRGRAECVPLYEQLLEPYRKIKSEGWVNPLVGLGFYYKQMGRYEEAIDTFLSIDQYTTAPHVIADLQVEAARVYRDSLHDDESARHWYRCAQSADVAVGWSAGVALLDQVRRCALVGDTETASLLLQTPVTGERGKQVLAGQWLARADLALRAGDRQAAAAAFRQVIGLAATVDNPLPALETWVRSAREGLELLGHLEAAGPAGLWLAAEDVVLRTSWHGTVEGQVALRGSRRMEVCVQLPGDLGEARSGSWWLTAGGVWRTVVAFALEPQQLPLLEHSQPLRLCADGVDVQLRLSPALL